jgi:hypothetical protein
MTRKFVKSKKSVPESNVDYIKSLCESLKTKKTETFIPSSIIDNSNELNSDTEYNTEHNNKEKNNKEKNNKEKNLEQNIDKDTNEILNKLNEKSEEKEESYMDKLISPGLKEQVGQLLMYAMSNPQGIGRLLENIKSSVDNVSDNINPDAFSKKATDISNYYHNVNLALKYNEMMKMMVSKYWDSFVFREDMNNFDIHVEGNQFNQLLKKIWDLMKLILCEIAACNLDDLVCSIPSCSGIQFETYSSILEDQQRYLLILKELGYPEITCYGKSKINLEKIKYNYRDIRYFYYDIISKLQRKFVSTLRKNLKFYFDELEKLFNNLKSKNLDNETVLEPLKEYLKTHTAQELYNLSEYPSGVNIPTNYPFSEFKHLLEEILELEIGVYQYLDEFNIELNLNSNIDKSRVLSSLFITKFANLNLNEYNFLASFIDKISDDLTNLHPVKIYADLVKQSQKSDMSEEYLPCYFDYISTIYNKDKLKNLINYSLEMILLNYLIFYTKNINSS